MLVINNYLIDLAHPSIGLYFLLNGEIHLPGDSVLISDIGPLPADRRNPGSTLVCVTTNVNTACCRSKDNNGFTNDTAGAVGEWLYPNTTLVPRADGNLSDVVRIGFTHQIRLARAILDAILPLGLYTCQVPEPSTGVLNTATIIVQGYRYKYLC